MSKARRANARLARIEENQEKMWDAFREHVCACQGHQAIQSMQQAEREKQKCPRTTGGLEMLVRLAWIIASLTRIVLHEASATERG